MTDPLAPAWRGPAGKAHELAILQHGLTYDDLLQEARLAVWLAGAADGGMVYTIACRRMIDAVRRWSGRHRQFRGNAGRLSLDALITPGDPDTLGSLLADTTCVEDEVIAILDVDNVIAWAHIRPPRVVDAILAQGRGETLAGVAARHGVTESRI